MVRPLSIVISLLALSLAVQAAPAPNQKWVLDLEKSSGTVEFKAIGRPSALKINGKGDKAKGTLNVDGLSLTGMASFSLDSLDTGIKLRNEHMKKKFLETEKFPEAKFTFTKVVLPEALNSENSSIDKLPFEGKLLLHGVEKPVSGVAKIERKGSEISVVASFGLKISDYGIPTPGFAGITMAEDVDVQVQFSGPYTKAQ